MQFQVPQFIEVEDKIGPLTFKQYIYIGGSIGLSVILYLKIPNTVLALFLIVPIITFGCALAFYQHNNRPFIFLVESFFYYIIGEKLFIWRKKPLDVKSQTTPVITPTLIDNSLPRITQGNLHKLSLKLDRKEVEKNISDRL